MSDSGLDRLSDIISPLGGLVSAVLPLRPFPGDPAVSVYGASLGDVSMVLPNARAGEGGDGGYGEMDGAGSDFGDGAGKVRAAAEALERYSSCVFAEGQFMWATARELGSAALALESIPRCSERELANPACPLIVPDLDAPLRWVRGVSLMSGELKWIPATMIYLHFPWLSIGERIALPISTGCAAHPSIERALLSGLCEVIERDAIALVWLQRLSLPEILVDAAEGGEAAVALARASRPYIVNRFFDATTDLGVPTVYLLQLSDHHPRLATMVMCATDLDPARAVAKVLREAAASRIAMQVPREIPAHPDEFAGVFHGATYMGAPERRFAFDFLLHPPRTVALSSLPRLECDDAAEDLRRIVARLRALGMDAFAVDLTTDEAISAGMRVVKVLVPALQPLSFSRRASYLGHPRLYAAPAAMGQRSLPEEDLNPWPQPFA